MQTRNCTLSVIFRSAFSCAGILRACSIVLSTTSSLWHYQCLKSKRRHRSIAPPSIYGSHRRGRRALWALDAQKMKCLDPAEAAKPVAVERRVHAPFDSWQVLGARTLELGGTQSHLTRPLAVPPLCFSPVQPGSYNDDWHRPEDLACRLPDGDMLGGRSLGARSTSALYTRQANSVRCWLALTRPNT